MEQKVNKKSLKEQVQDILYNKIISGEFAAGERLKILHIANALGASQAPVREAIQCLVTGGYLEYVPNAGVKVKGFSDKDIVEFYELRKALELSALQNGRADYKELYKELKPNLDKMKQSVKSNSYKDYAIYDTAFHRAIVAAAHNCKMLCVWDSLLVPKYVSNTIRKTGIKLDAILPLHAELVSAVKQGDKELAAKFLIQHYIMLNI